MHSVTVFKSLYLLPIPFPFYVGPPFAGGPGQIAPFAPHLWMPLLPIMDFPRS